MTDRIASFRLPPLWEACPAWEPTGVRDWLTPLPESMERSRSIGKRVPYDRDGGRLKWGTVVGSTAPAVPSEGELLRGGEGLCARGVRVRGEDGKVRTVQSSRLRELRRSPRPMEAGLRLSWMVAEQVATEARLALSRGDVRASDEARSGTLPFPHRAGSTPCSGPNRPALVLEDFAAWESGDGFEQWELSDALGRAREMLRGAPSGLSISSAGDVLPAALAVESHCVEVWEKWVEKGRVGQRRQIIEKRAAIRSMYPSVRKHSAAVVKGGRITFGPVTPSRAGRARRGGLSYFRPG